MPLNLTTINNIIDRIRARILDFFSRGKSWRRRIALFLAVLGPGLITSNVDNDAGGIATYTQAGSAYGYALLWSLIPMTIALYVTMEMCARMGVITGKGLSDLIREEFGLRSTFFVMTAGFLVDLGNVVAEFAGVAAAAQLFGVNKLIAVPLAAIAVWILVLKGSLSDLIREEFVRPRFRMIRSVDLGNVLDLLARCGALRRQQLIAVRLPPSLSGFSC